MKNSLTLLFILFSATVLLAQPANDDCVGLIDLGTAPICPSPAIYTNEAATESNIGNDNLPFCFNGNPERDVWFSFVASNTVLNYEITVSGITMTMPQVAVYRGDCEFDGLVLLDCAAANTGEDGVSIVLTGLTPGLTYFLRVNDWTTSGSANSGTFELCIQEFVDMEFNINETGTDQCEGSLYDTGGPSGNYGTDENNVFSICPTNPGECIVMNVLNYNMAQFGTSLSFYDGPDNSSPLIATIMGGANGFTNGGVCYPIVATSGCLSVEMITGGFGTFEGFAAEWFCTDDCPMPGTIEIETGPSASDIETALDNEFMDITVTSINCSTGAYGVFSQGDETNLGLDAGLLLTTGSAAEVANPASFFASSNLNLGGDPELNELNDLFGMGGNTNDACIVELDVIPKTTNVTFEYVFGSDEYKDQFSQFSDDLIGILISGPGIPGIPALNNQLNMADLPTAPNTLISIQSVNATDNWQYYRNNLNSQSIAYNGLTAGFLGEQKTLLADQIVTPCESYHVKIAIGDTDENDDSGLFINPTLAFLPSIAVNLNTGISYLVEDCTTIESTINLEIPEPVATPTVFNVEIAGSAIEGEDFDLDIPSTVTFAPGETVLSFPLNVINDGLPEGTETITISLIQDFGCGEVIMASQTINIEDELQVQIVPSQDTIFVCAGINTAQLQAIGAASYSWSPAGVFNNANIGNPIATITSSQTVTVTGTLGTCSVTDEVFLQIVSPEIEIQADGSTDLCQGEGVTLTAVNNVSNAGLVWDPIGGLQDPGSAVTLASPFATTTYTATVTAAAGCTASDEITVTVEPFDFPDMVIGDTTICQNSSVMLASSVFNSSTDFQWTPDQWLDDASIAGATATPEQTTTYTLNATSPSGTCTGTAEVTVTVLPADIEIDPETLEICLGESVQIDAMSSTAGTGLVWSPTDSLVAAGVESVIVNPTISTWYFATLTVGACVVSDSVFVRVDSLPNMAIEAIPAKETYCEGENISLVSPNYDFQDFPDMMFMWEPNTGVISSDTLYNLVINATTTTTYIRTTTNHACSAMDTIDIIVTPTAIITVTPEDPSVCAGESVDLLATADQEVEGWEWSPEAGLSCIECPDPTATPPGTITYQVQAEFMGCPSFATVQVEVTSLPFNQGDNFICQGESTFLNVITAPGATYQWTSTDGTFNSTEAEPMVTPSQTTTYNLVAVLDGCTFERTVTVEVAEDFTVAINPLETACPGDQITLTAVSEASGLVYTWLDAAGDPIGIGATLDWTADVTSTFTVVAEDQNTPPCFSRTAAITVDVSPAFTVVASADPSGTVQGGEEVTLTGNGSIGGLTYEWFGVDTLVPFSTEQSTVVSSCLSVFYEVVATDANGCTQSDGIIVDVENSFSIFEDSSFVFPIDSFLPIYEGEEFQIGTMTDPPMVAGANFSWELGGLVVSNTSDTISEILTAPEVSGGEETFVYDVILTDNFGCRASDTIHVTVLDNPVEVPNVFTPNGDGTNDLFLPISQYPVDFLEFKIWNRWGQLVYENENAEAGWDGLQNDKAAASDVYIYRLVWQLKGGVGAPVVEKGDVTLLR